MSQIKKIYVIACQHGDELFGLKILSRLETANLPSLKLRTGNIEAIAKKTRYIDSDLNRSFTSKLQTRESRVARLIRAEINDYKPDLVIDIHTSTVGVGCVAITAKRTHRLNELALRLGMDNIVVMLPEITKTALLGIIPSRSISLEFGKGLRSDKLADDIANKIVSLLNDNSQRSSKTIDEYQIIRIVKKDEIQDLTYANFVFNKTLRGYPFLMGEASYTDYAGFLARKLN